MFESEERKKREEQEEEEKDWVRLVNPLWRDGARSVERLFAWCTSACLVSIPFFLPLIWRRERRRCWKRGDK